MAIYSSYMDLFREKIHLFLYPEGTFADWKGYQLPMKINNKKENSSPQRGLKDTVYSGTKHE